MPRASILLTALGLALWVGACSQSYAVSDDAAVGANVDVVGTFNDCLSTRTYAADGTATLVDHKAGCTTRARWVVAGERLTTTIDESTCPEAVIGQTSASSVTRVEGGLVSVNTETGAIARLADSTTPVTTWTLSSPSTPSAEQIVRVVGRPGMGFGSACYWTRGSGCGVFSCSGSLPTWTIEAGHLTVGASCGGPCPCGAVAQADIQADGSFDGTFRSVNCERSIEGSFHAVSGAP